MPYAICYMPYAICHMPHAICYMIHAICYMISHIWSMISWACHGMVNNQVAVICISFFKQKKKNKKKPCAKIFVELKGSYRKGILTYCEARGMNMTGDVTIRFVVRI